MNRSCSGVPIFEKLAVLLVRHANDGVLGSWIASEKVEEGKIYNMLFLLRICADKKAGEMCRILYEVNYGKIFSQNLVALGSNYAPHPRRNMSVDAAQSPVLHLYRGAVHCRPMTGAAIATRESSHLMNWNAVLVVS